MSRANVQLLKKLVAARFRSLSHVTSFTATCGYVWSCMVKTRAATEGRVDDDEIEYFRFLANCRANASLPLPANYFGNGVVPCIASAKNGQLMEDAGFMVAAKSIGETIRGRLRNEKGFLNGAENWISDLEAVRGKRTFSASPLAAFKLYGLDFGWGKPKKIEMVAIDDAGTMPLHESGDTQGDLEIGLSLPDARM